MLYGASCSQLPVVKRDLSEIDWLPSSRRHDEWTELIHFSFPMRWLVGYVQVTCLLLRGRELLLRSGDAGGRMIIPGA
jgi:hypothetical protein